MVVAGLALEAIHSGSQPPIHYHLSRMALPVEARDHRVVDSRIAVVVEPILQAQLRILLVGILDKDLRRETREALIC